MLSQQKVMNYKRNLYPQVKETFGDQREQLSNKSEDLDSERVSDKEIDN